MRTIPLANLWDILRQVNFGEIHAEASRPVATLVVGPPDSPLDTLAGLLREGERYEGTQTESIVRTATLPLPPEAGTGVSLILAVDTDPHTLGVNPSAPVLFVSTRPQDSARPVRANAVYLPTIDWNQVEHGLALAIIEKLDDHALAAARRLPILRHAYAKRLIQETAQANAVYAFSTGLAEMVPALNIPLNVADIVVLTKNQALMVYKLALAAGRPMSPRRVMGELLGVIGAGFMWRQIARELVGLIPAVGLIPKVVVAYAGTYAIGEAAHLYLVEGKVPAGDQLKTLYQEAVEKGHALAQTLIQKRNSEANSENDEPKNYSHA